jgi:general secretion pathway protein K
MSSSYVFSAVAFSDASRADELGRTAVNLVVQQTLSRDPDAARGGSFVVHLNDADVYVDYLSETARVDVNFAQPEFFVALFKAAGVEPEEADAIGERIKAWIHQQGLSGGANASATQVQPRESKILIEHVAQVADAWGVAQDVLAKVKSSLTVSNPSGKVDPILADKLIIEAIFDGDQLSADNFLRQRAQGFATESDALMSIPLGARGYVGFSRPKAFRARVRVQLFNRTERRYEMVVVPPQSRGDTVQVTAWEAL